MMPIWHGSFIEARSSVVYAVALGCCIYLFSLYRFANIGMRLTSIMGIISGVITTSFANIIPYKQGVITLANLIFRPIGLGISLSVFLSCSVFPLTTQYRVINIAIQQLSLFKKYSTVSMEVLQEKKPSDQSFGNTSELSKLMTKSKGLSFRILLSQSGLCKDVAYLRFIRLKY